MNRPKVRKENRKSYSWVSDKDVLKRLEPDAGKLARPVLRGVSGGNTARLPDFSCPYCSRSFALVQEDVAKLELPLEIMERVRAFIPYDADA